MRRARDVLSTRRRSERLRALRCASLLLNDSLQVARDECCDVGENDRSCGTAGACEEDRIPLGVEPLLEFPDALKVVESLPIPAYGNRKLVPDRCAAVNAESAERCHPEVEPA